MNQLITTDVKMTSLDIAEVTGKEHKNVMRDVRNEIKELGEEEGLLIFELTERVDSHNRKQPVFSFGKEGAMQLALKYDAKTRRSVIKYVERLESKPQLPPNNTKLLLETALKHETKLEEIESDVTYLKGNMRINSLQQQSLQRSARLAVVRSLGGKDTPAYKELSKKVFPAMWNEFKHHFEVPRYPDLPKIKFDEAKKFIELWRPSTSLQIKINNYNGQMSFVKE